jgi:CRISPR-associated protein Csh1
MLESILKIGENNINNAMDLFIKEVSGSNKKENIMVLIIFDIDNNGISTDYRRLDNNIAKEYNWIGNTFAASRERIRRLTTDKIEKINTGEIIDNMLKSIQTLKELNMNDNDLQNLQILENKINEIKTNIKQPIKDLLNAKLEQYKKYNIVLYTICIKENGKIIDLATTDWYKTFIRLDIKYPKNLIDGKCHICGNQTKILTDPAFEGGSILKIYNIDKKGFISGISSHDEDMKRTFVICPECRWNLIVGEKFVKKNLELTIDTLNMYIIPRVEPYDYKVVERIKDKMERVTYNKPAEADKLQDIDETLTDSQRYDNIEWYTINIIIGKRGQADFKLEGFIQEVPITNISKLAKEMSNITKIASSQWSDEESRWRMSLESIMRLIPLRKSGRDIDYKPFIELLDSLLHLTKYNYYSLIKSYALLAHIYRYESYEGYNIRRVDNSDYGLVYTTIMFNYFFVLLKNLEMIEMRTNTTDIKDISVGDEHMDNWLKSMGYNEYNTALFLLGYIIAQIGNAQYKKGDEKKSILDKIDFKGMKKERILLLACELLQSLRNYKILNYNESYYYKMMELLNKAGKEIDKDPIENLFYILSGYAYGTYKVINKDWVKMDE